MNRLSRFLLTLLLLLVMVGPSTAPAAGEAASRYVVLEGFYNPG